MGTVGIVDGVGADAPMVTNENGGRQSHLPYRCELLPARATLEVAGVLERGARKYGDDNWRLISTREHLNHALTHIFAWLAGDGQDGHLGHAACRALMALEIDLAGGPRATDGQGEAKGPPEADWPGSLSDADLLSQYDAAVAYFGWHEVRFCHPSECRGVDCDCEYGQSFRRQNALYRELRRRGLRV